MPHSISLGFGIYIDDEVVIIELIHPITNNIKYLNSAI